MEVDFFLEVDVDFFFAVEVDLLVEVFFLAVDVVNDFLDVDDFLVVAEEVDFFSIGTNDLTQYTLAIDRQNPSLDPFYDSHHPAVLKLIEMTADAAHKHDCWVGICGELGADTSLTETFLRMGIDELSVNPGSVLGVRKTIRSINLKSE